MNSKMKKAAVIAAIVIAAVVQVHAEEWIVKVQETRQAAGQEAGQAAEQETGKQEPEIVFVQAGGNQTGRLIRPVGQHRVQGLSLRQ